MQKGTVNLQVGDWVWSEDHLAVCQAVDVECCWGETFKSQRACHFDGGEYYIACHKDEARQGLPRCVTTPGNRVITCEYDDEQRLAAVARDDENGDDFYDDFCKHVVFAHTWGFDLWDGNNAIVKTGNAVLDEKVREAVCDCLDPEDIVKVVIGLLRRNKPKDIRRRISDGGGYAERDMGPQGGGPKYTLIFMRDDPAKPRTGPASS